MIVEIMSGRLDGMRSWFISRGLHSLLELVPDEDKIDATTDELAMRSIILMLQAGRADVRAFGHEILGLAGLVEHQDKAEALRKVADEKGDAAIDLAALSAGIIVGAPGAGRLANFIREAIEHHERTQGTATPSDAEPNE